MDPTLLTVYPDFVERMNVLIPPDVVAALSVFPAQMELNAIHVCMLNPTDGWTARTLESISGCRVMSFVTLETALTAAIDQHYGKFLGGPAKHTEAAAARAQAEAAYRRLLEAEFDDYLRPAIALINRNRDAMHRDPRALEQVIREPVIIRLVQQMICRGVETGASDMHVEPTEEGLRVRARVDGAMRHRAYAAADRDRCRLSPA